MSASKSEFVAKLSVKASVELTAPVPSSVVLKELVRNVSGTSLPEAFTPHALVVAKRIAGRRPSFGLAFAGAGALLYSGLPSAAGLSPRSTRKATWRSGYATVCKTVYPGSIPGVASNNFKGIARNGYGRRAELPPSCHRLRFPTLPNHNEYAPDLMGLGRASERLMSRLNVVRAEFAVV